VSAEGGQAGMKRHFHNDRLSKSPWSHQNRRFLRQSARFT